MTPPNEAPIVMYTTTFCPYCVRAKLLLKKRGIPYRDINVGGNPEARAWLVRATGRRTVPQIFIHGESIGGCDELHVLDRLGHLERLLHDGPREGPPANGEAAAPATPRFGGNTG